MGLIAYRIMMVLTAVRHLDNVIHKSSSDETVQLVCHEFDYSVAMSICDTLLYHAVFIYQNLSGNQFKRFNTVSQETGVYARRNTLYNMLPDTFTKKDYDAAVICSGTCGFGMGATPNAMANMQAVCEKYVPSVKAYLLIPIVGSLFADFINSLVITLFINFL